MRWTKRASLSAGVAAIALIIGPQPGSLETNTLRDFVPVQIGTAAEAQVRASVGIFYDSLAPHGRWVRNRSHGFVFVPAGLGRDWRPYTRGHWVHTNDYGWYWVSEEPFGWATYHYGRWGYDRSYGWYWVPGNVWAPAWVTWRTGGDHIGWAPLAPEGSGYAWGAPSAYRPPVAESWVFVETRYISAPTIIDYVAPIVEIPRLLTQAPNRVDVRVDQDIVINQPVEITQIENVVAEPIRTLDVTFADDPGEIAVSEEGLVAFQADIGEEEPEEEPAEAVESPEELEDPAVFEETLDEVPEEADAPSAADIEDEPAEPDDVEEEEDPDAEDEPVDEEPGPETEEEPVDEPAETEEPADEAEEAEVPEEAEPDDEEVEPGEPEAETPEGEPDAPAEEEEPVDEPTDEVEPEAEEPAADAPAEEPEVTEPQAEEPVDEAEPEVVAPEEEPAAPTEEQAPGEEPAPDAQEEPAEAPAEAVAPEEAAPEAEQALPDDPEPEVPAPVEEEAPAEAEPEAEEEELPPQ